MISSYAEHTFYTITPFSGVMWPPLHQISADRYDLQFATNVMGTMFRYISSHKFSSSLGHFLLTHLLLANLRAGAKSLPEKKSRVINTSSGASYLTHRIDWETLVDGPKRRAWWSSTEALYHQSKFVCRCLPYLSIFESSLVIRQTSYSQTNSQGGTETRGSSRYR